MSDHDVTGTVSFFRERQRIEAATTSRVLRSMTPEMLAYRVHPASSTLGTIAWTIVRCLRICTELCRSGVSEVPRAAPPALNELLVTYEQFASEFNVCLLTMTQNDWESKRVVTSGQRVLLEQPLGQIFWLFHADSIHHRGQLSVFLRLFGAKVPSIYGPSGDCGPQPIDTSQGEAYEA